MLAPAKIGIVGTGFIGLGLAVALESTKTLTLSAILTRRDTGSINSRHRDKLTTSLNRLIDQSDLIVECTGDAIYATEIVDRVLSAGRPIVTMNSEFHVTTGSYFTDRGVLTESQGDQPGSIAASFGAKVSQTRRRALLRAGAELSSLSPGDSDYDPSYSERRLAAIDQFADDWIAKWEEEKRDRERVSTCH